MEDVEPLEEFRPGHSIDEIEIRRELYRLVTMILTSGPIAETALYWCRKEKYQPGYRTHYLQGLAARYFEDELSRILIYTAIQSRLYASMKYPSSFPIWEEACGELEQGPTDDVPLGEGPLGGKIVPLTLREAFNKIIHATIMNTDSEAVRDGESWLRHLFADSVYNRDSLLEQGGFKLVVPPSFFAVRRAQAPCRRSR